jgi:hypothetical protein
LAKLKQLGPQHVHKMVGQLLKAETYSKRNNDCPESETISKVINDLCRRVAMHTRTYRQKIYMEL